MKITYSFYGNLGRDEIATEAGDMMALRLARIYGGREDLQIITRHDGDKATQIHAVQMLYGPRRAANLRGAYGSASKRAATKAEREFSIS